MDNCYDCFSSQRATSDHLKTLEMDNAKGEKFGKCVWGLGGGGGLWLSEFLAVDLSLWFSFLFVPAWQHFCVHACLCV